MKKTYISNALLLLTAIIWGVSFVAQDSAGEIFKGTFTICASRFLIGGLIVLPFAIISCRKEKKNVQDYAKYIKKSILAGAMCGLALFVASNLQQYGMILGTGSDKAGFITAMYMVLVPLLGLFFKKKVTPLCWVAVAIAPIGMYLLCIKEGFTFNVCDLFVLGCALCYAVQILLIDTFTKTCNPVLMSSIQFFTVSILGAICMLIFEGDIMSGVMKVIPQILYLGIFSSGVGYTLQVVAQKNTNPTVASLLMSLESVFALLSAVIILHKVPSTRELIGCLIMFIVIILSQIPEKQKKTK